MHTPLTFHSYLKPATLPPVPKMYNEVQNLGLFSFDLDVTQLIFHHIHLKRTYNVIFKIFSVIKIYKQSLIHKFWGFILILSVPWGQLRTKCPCHKTFFHQSGTFLVCFCGNTNVSLDDHHGSDGFVLIIWTLSLCEVVKLKSIRYIPQHLYTRILKFLVLAFHLSGLFVILGSPMSAKVAALANICHKTKFQEVSFQY